jgi:hypothetical protein
MALKGAHRETEKPSCLLLVEEGVHASSAGDCSQER